MDYWLSSVYYSPRYEGNVKDNVFSMFRKLKMNNHLF